MEAVTKVEGGCSREQEVQSFNPAIFPRSTPAHLPSTQETPEGQRTCPDCTEDFTALKNLRELRKLKTLNVKTCAQCRVPYGNLYCRLLGYYNTSRRYTWHNDTTAVASGRIRGSNNCRRLLQSANEDDSTETKEDDSARNNTTREQTEHE